MRRGRLRGASVSGGRAGGALLWSAFGLLCVFLMWGLLRSFVTSTTRAEAHAIVETRLCQSLAESALAEVEAQFGLRVNDLGSGLASALRQQVPAGQKGERDLTDLFRLDETRSLLRLPSFAGFEVDCRCRIQFQRPLDRVPYERKGLVVFTATASSPGLVRRVRRQVELARWLKTTLVTTPRPFADYGLFIVDATGLTDVDTVNRLRDRSAEIARRIRASVADLAGRAPSAFRQEYRSVLAEVFDPDAARAMPDPLSLPGGSAVCGLVRSGGTQKLARLDLATRMSRLVEKAEAEEQSLTRCKDRVESSDRSVQKEILKTMKEAASAAVSPLFELWAFHEGYSVLPPGGSKEARSLGSLLYKLRLDYFVRRAHWLLKETPGLTDLSTAFRALADRSVQGVVVVDNQRLPLRLSGRIRGRLIVVVGPGGATIQDLNPPPEEKAIITVFAHSGRIQVSGQNSVTLVLGRGPESLPAPVLQMQPGARIVGGLIMASLPPGGRLDGEVTRDDSQFSGFSGPDGTDHGVLDRTFVGLSPRVCYRRVSRP